MPHPVRPDQLIAFFSGLHQNDITREILQQLRDLSKEVHKGGQPASSKQSSQPPAPKSNTPAARGGAARAAAAPW